MVCLLKSYYNILFYIILNEVILYFIILYYMKLFVVMFCFLASYRFIVSHSILNRSNRILSFHIIYYIFLTDLFNYVSF